MSEDLSMFGVAQPAAPAAATATAAPVSGEDLSMFGVTNPAPPKQDSFLDHPIDSTKNYVTGWAGAIHDAVGKLWNANSTYKTDIQTAGALASSAVAPIGAALTAGPKMNYSTDENGGLIATEDPTDKGSTYSQRKADLTYNPTDPAAQAKVQLIGATLKPIPDALKGVASVFTSNTEHQEMIADALQYAIPGLKDTIKVGADALTGTKASSIVSHPAVVAANDLGTKYNIPLTKGQQVAQAATDLGANDTATAKALQVPYQLEAKTATQSSKLGQQYSNHFDTQQNTLASHVQGVADDLRKAGDTDSADLVENAITEKSPGVNAVDGNKLQKAVDKSDISDPTIAAKLNDLNDLSGVIDKPAKLTAAEPGTVQKFVDKFGSYVGAGTGAVIGGKLGHPVIGAEIGAGLGSRAVTNFFRTNPTAGPLDVSSLSTADIGAMAKKAGVSPDVMTQQLMQKQAAAPAPVAPLTTAVSPSVTPLPARTMPTVDFTSTPSAPGAAPAPAVTDFTSKPSAPSSGFTSLTKDHGVRTRDVGTQVLDHNTDFDSLLRAGLVNDPYDLGGVYRMFRDR